MSNLLLYLGILVLLKDAYADPTRDSCNGTAPVPPTRVDTAARVAALRQKMKAKGVYAFIIPTADDHQNEYVENAQKRRTFISGFDGSAGTAVVTEEAALLWTDGRYFLQAADQLDCDWLLMREGETGVPSITGWILDNVQPGQKVGAYAKVISARSWKNYMKTFEKKGLSIEDTVDDLVGAVWTDQGGKPSPSDNPVTVLDIEFAGRSWENKTADLRNKLEDSKVDAVVISALDEVAWLFNLRGSDIDYNPVFFAFAFVPTDRTQSPKLFLRAQSTRKGSITSHLNANADGQCTEADCVEVQPYSSVDDEIKKFNEKNYENKTIWISDSTNYYIAALVTNQDQVKTDPSPVLLMKAIKNPEERDGMRNAHIRDSAVIVQLIARLERELDEGIEWDELKVVKELDGLRMNQTNNRGLSFGTIAGSGKNGAYIHYSPNKITNNAVNKTNMLLLDSGGQYLDGTTDITRTFHFGEPTDFQKLAYTLVLLGVIDLAMVRFPTNKTLGSSLDPLARRPMWEYGLDFGHGTGHGIGMFLNVHEGPARISPRRQSSYVSNERPIYDGMFFSDEPGYYDEKEGFGVRLETIVMATYVDTQYGAPKSTLTFETIAYVPFEKKLIKLEMLDKRQREWLNEYHKRCLEKTGKFLQDGGMDEAYNWLKERTDPVPMPGTTTPAEPTKPAGPTKAPSCDCPDSAHSAVASMSIILLAAAVGRLI